MASWRGGPCCEDWRDPAAYAWLLGCDRCCFAWEWLRRDARYRAAFARRQKGAHAFSLCCFADPLLDARAAKPFWRACVDPTVVSLTACPPTGDEGIDLTTLGSLLSLHRDGQGEHVLLSDGLHMLRLDILSGSIGSGAVSLTWRLGGLGSAGMGLLTLQRLIALVEAGHFLPSLHHTPTRVARCVDVLRVHDGLVDGASYRDLAATLYGEDVAGPRWRVTNPSWHLRVRRLAGAEGSTIAALGGGASRSDGCPHSLSLTRNRAAIGVSAP